jgi:phosphoglucomutase
MQVQEQFIINNKGEKVSVILPIEEYVDLLEDLHDLAIIAERKDEPTISFDSLKVKLKSDGFI